MTKRERLSPYEAGRRLGATMPKITDPEVLSRLARIIRAADESAPPSGSPKDPAGGAAAGGAAPSASAGRNQSEEAS